MQQMSDQQKLRFLLSHWAKHNDEHANEYQKWARRAEQFGGAEVVAQLKQAVQTVETVNRHLINALDLLGGPVAQDHGDHQTHKH
jgi:hypothetical protein